MDKITTCVFDAYGTLFDVNAACRELSKEVGDRWNDLSTLWRLRQVEYTWLRNSMNEYIDFWKITSDLTIPVAPDVNPVRIVPARIV